MIKFLGGTVAIFLFGYLGTFFGWWGIVLIFHAVGTFGIPNLFSKDWEERKIKEYMNNNR